MSVQGREGRGGREHRWTQAQHGAALRVEGACLLMCRETAQMEEEINSDPSNFHEAGGQGIGLLQGDEKWTEADFLRILRKVI